jgi:arylamine N-acetyltransferase
MDTLKAFTAHYGIQLSQSRRQLLSAVVNAFAGLPYENITKIIKRAEHGTPEKSRRYPAEVIRDHISWGTGGTCFSLTSALMDLVRSLGWEAEYILADRSYGQDTHCALLLRIDGIPHLLDPGFLIVNPIPIDGVAEREIKTEFNRLILVPESRGDRIALTTVRQDSKAYRLTYKTSPVEAGEFQKAWDASFDWEMMHYPLLTRTTKSGQIYLRGGRLQISKAGLTEKREIKRDDLVARISGEFQINPQIVARAISILKSGEKACGTSSSR